MNITSRISTFCGYVADLVPVVAPVVRGEMLVTATKAEAAYTKKGVDTPADRERVTARNHYVFSLLASCGAVAILVAKKVINAKAGMITGGFLVGHALVTLYRTWTPSSPKAPEGMKGSAKQPTRLTEDEEDRTILPKTGTPETGIPDGAEHKGAHA